MTDQSPPSLTDQRDDGNGTRRTFLMTIGAGAAMALAACSSATREAFFQKHFRELSRKELEHGEDPLLLLRAHAFLGIGVGARRSAEKFLFLTLMGAQGQRTRLARKHRRHRRVVLTTTPVIKKTRTP